MKKLIAVTLLLMCFSATYAGKAGTEVNAVPSHGKNACYDSNGKWSPTNKNCDQNSCGCLWHEIEEFVKSMFG